MGLAASHPAQVSFRYIGNRAGCGTGTERLHLWDERRMPHGGRMATVPSRTSGSLQDS